MRLAWRGWVLSALLPLLAAPVGAQIRIGQTAAFSGPTSASVQEGADGARLYLDAINAQGGVKGQRIEIVSMDDRYEPQLSAANARSLIAQGVVALFMTRGTGPTQAVLPLLAGHRLALLAPATGAMSLREPVQPFVFNLRASYQREAERAVRHLAGIGVRRLTIVQVNDEFGNDAGLGALKGLQAVNLRASAHLRFDRNRPELAPLMQQIAKAGIEAVLMIGPSYAVVEGVQALRAAGSTAHVATLSNNATADFVRSLGDQARGIVVTQLFPYERSQQHPLVREARQLAVARGRAELTPSQLEGFAAAKLLVEALRRVPGREISRESLLRALEGLQRVDLGGLDLSYGPKQHGGLDFTDVSIIGPDGKFWR